MEENEEYYKGQSEQFDKAADYYDKFRPSYPKEVIDYIIEKTGIKEGANILEVGAGSGKATELFVDRGFNMLCIEPGHSLVEAGERKFSYTDKVKYHEGRLEEWDEIKEKFNLAISAQAFHWVPKPIGFQKCANALKSKGYIALFWNLYLTDNSPIDMELKETGMFLLQSKESCDERIKFHIEEIKDSGCFKGAVAYSFPWSQRYTAEEYVGFMKTGNGYLSASEGDRRLAEEKIYKIVNKYGGAVEREYLCVVFIAEKL